MTFRKTLLFSFFFIFLPLSSSVFAYTMFSANPYFDNAPINNYSQGVILYNSLYNNSFYQNDTCDGMTNCVIIENNGTAQTNDLYLQENDYVSTGITPQWTNSTALTAFNSANSQNGIKYYELNLPANEEGIIVTNYRWNNTLTTPIPIFFVIDVATGNYLNSTQLNTTINSWNNLTIIINASSSARNLRMGFYWNWDNLPSRLEIDKFKFYTLDLNEFRESWSANATYEVNRYCGVNSTFECAGNAEEDYFGVYRNGDTAMLYGLDMEGLYCEAYKLGNITIVRRAKSLDAQGPSACSGCGYQLHFLNDGMIFFRSLGGGTCNAGLGLDGMWLMESHSLLTAKITTIYNYSSTIQYGKEAYNNNPASNVSWPQTLNKGNNSFAIRQTINLNTSASPAGSQWKFCLDIPSSYCGSFYNFFSVNTITFNAGWSCNSNINYEQYIDSTGNTTQNNYCGDCGCGATRCNSPIINGTYCDLTDPNYKTIITSTTTCQNISKQCPSNTICQQLTPQINVSSSLVENLTSCMIRTNLGFNIQCFTVCSLIGNKLIFSNCVEDVCKDCSNPLYNSVSYYRTGYNQTISVPQFTACCINPSTGKCDLIIDENGQNTTLKKILNSTGVNCTDTASICYDTDCNVISCPLPTISTNAFGYVALSFGSIFGMGDSSFLTIDEAGLSILSALIVAFFALYYEKESEHAGTFASIAFIGVFLICTIMSGNAWLYGIFAMVAILDAAILSGALKKIIGGG